MLTNSEVIAPGGNKKRFDVVINAIGYEDRARFSVESDIVSANNYISLAFEKTSLFGYSKNIEIMTVLGASIIERVSLQTENDAIDKKIRELHEGKPLNIACDISSMNRSMISAVFRALIRNLDIIRSASIIYTPAKFSPPSSDYPQIDQIGPVTPELSGYQSAPSLPIGLLIGLGYEFGIAAGILNGLEPKLTIAFRAVGNDPRYEKAVRTANFNFAFGISRCDVTDYSLMRPDQAARYVDDILASMTRQYRCVLVPMGPKLLSAIFILAGFRYFGEVAVWRVSEIGKKAHNAEPDNRIVVSEIDFSRAFGPELQRNLSDLYSEVDMAASA